MKALFRVAVTKTDTGAANDRFIISFKRSAAGGPLIGHIHGAIVAATGRSDLRGDDFTCNTVGSAWWDWIVLWWLANYSASVL